MTAVHAGNLNFKWDPKSLEIRTLAVERLVTQVTTPVNTNSKGPSNKKRGHSKKAHVLAASVELVAAVEDVQKQGDLMKTAAGKFADDPCSSVKQGNMVRALLILADMANVYILLVQLKVVEDGILKLRNAYLGIQCKALKPEVEKLNIMAAKRQEELKDVGHHGQMAAAREILQKNVLILYTASQACLQHPDIANRDLIYKQLQQAVTGISNAAQATASDDASQHQGGGGEVAYVLNNFDKQIIVDPSSFSKECFRPSLEEHLESIISAAAFMGDSPCTHDDHHERIVAECNAVLQVLQDLLLEYMGKAGCKERSDTLNSAIDKMNKKTRDLCRQLHKAVMDHVSDSFLETNVPLLLQRMEMRNKEYANVFCEHGNKLIGVANLACSISNNEEGVKLVRMSASQLEALFCVLTDAVDDVTFIDDFLAVSENHILENVNKCVIALQEKDVDGLDHTAGAIQGRAPRGIHVVSSEMNNYEPGKVLEATKLLSNTVMPRFTEQAEVAMEALSSDPAQPMDENEFIDASHLVYGGIWDIRKAVLMIRTPEDLDDSDFEMEDFNVRSRMSIQTEDNQLIAGQSVQAIMAQLPQEQKVKIAEQVASFQEEKSKLDAEVSKRDDSANDIIVLAKQMCMIMMEMTDLTRGKGPLKNTLDVITAAKKIAEAGSRMGKLGRTIANHCPDLACKQGCLLAYLHCIALYCHQLNICSKVKAEVQNLGGELFVPGVDSATHPMSPLPNTKSHRVMASLNLPPVSWKTKAPEKKPLVKRKKQDETQTKIKWKHVNPVQALSEFKAMDSI
uniref:Catenin alpha-1 n=1 Tax=Macaca nemestrina TaxID=9545 RepID=A0A2K6DRM2_MACNE